MRLTLSAGWTQPKPGVDRVAIAGYTAVIEQSQGHDNLGREQTIFEYTVLRDHFEIVETGRLYTRERAMNDVEAVIINHAMRTEVAV